MKINREIVIDFWFQVSWFRRRGEELHLLTVDVNTYSNDARFSLDYQPPNDWQLHVRSISERDAGLYECQISVHPPLIRTVYVSVSGEYFVSKLPSLYILIFSFNLFDKISIEN